MSAHTLHPMPRSNPDSKVVTIPATRGAAVLAYAEVCTWDEFRDRLVRIQGFSDPLIMRDAVRDVLQNIDDLSRRISVMLAQRAAPGSELVYTDLDLARQNPDAISHRPTLVYQLGALTAMSAIRAAYEQYRMFGLGLRHRVTALVDSLDQLSAQAERTWAAEREDMIAAAPAFRGREDEVEVLFDHDFARAPVFRLSLRSTSRS